MNKILLFFAIVGFMASCTNANLEPEVATPYTLQIPAGFPDPQIPEDNPMTLEGVSLGRKLYYDSILHPSKQLACATCHIQSKSFTSTAEVLPHVNLAWSHQFLWDGAEEGTLEDVMRFEIEDFFNTDLSDLQNTEEYPTLFHEAFGNKTITTENIAKALAQFFRTMNSGNSKFDRYIRGEEQFSNEEFLGFELFFSEEGDCFHCHATVFFTDNSLHNNALDSLPDPGRYLVTSDSIDYGKFKSPTLRNIELTGPYMHDGRYVTLEEVIDFYSEGLEASKTVDPLMKQLNNGGVQLTPEEKAGLLAFLKTLTDEEFLNNKELSRPQD